MEIWNYHPDTLELICKSVADESPLEPGVFLLPAHSTTITPPDRRDGNAIVFIQDHWEYVEDHRGETWWNINGVETVIQNLGDPSIAGLTNIEPIITPPEITKLTTEQKLSNAGISIDELKTLLGLNNAS